MSLLLLFSGGQTATNAAPVVNAGTDGNCTVGTGYGLQGSAVDDGLPSGTLTYLWSQQSGPGVAAFNNASDPLTTVTPPTAGTYVFRLTVSDGALSAFDEMTLTVVNNPSNADGMDLPWFSQNWF